MPDILTLRSKSTKKAKVRPEVEERIRSLTEELTLKGFVVRRENLARGHSYRVKSGKCVYVRNRVLFVDRRLPAAQQLSVLQDFVDTLSVDNSDAHR